MPHDLVLSAALTQNSMTRPLLHGTVNPQGAVLRTTAVHASEMFWRQLHFQEFDVSEMSMASLMILTSRGNRDWVGLPIFTSRRFFHTGVLVRADGPVKKPADLSGARVGVPEYQQTAAVWTRGALQHEFGVKPEEMIWSMERGADRSHAAATGFTPAPGLRLSDIPATDSIGAMLVKGDLDALVHYIVAENLVDRDAPSIHASPAVRHLFPDPTAEAVRYHRATGLYPINHCVVVRRSIAEQHPWLIVNLFHAFAQAKDQALSSAREVLSPLTSLGVSNDASWLDTDPRPYGITQNRTTLDALTQYAYEQGLTDRIVTADELFSEQTHEL